MLWYLVSSTPIWILKLFSIWLEYEGGPNMFALFQDDLCCSLLDAGTTTLLCDIARRPWFKNLNPSSSQKVRRSAGIVGAMPLSSLVFSLAMIRAQNLLRYWKATQSSTFNLCPVSRVITGARDKQSATSFSFPGRYLLSIWYWDKWIDRLYRWLGNSFLFKSDSRPFWWVTHKNVTRLENDENFYLLPP